MSDEKTGASRITSRQNNVGNSPSDVHDRIRELKIRARMGIWGLIAYVIVSVLSIPGNYLLPTVSESVRNFLGAAPPSNLISIALVIYAFSALTLVLSRIAQGAGDYKGWSHLFYLTSFYIFFSFAGTLRETYWAIFVSGLLIMGLENYLIKTYVAEELKKAEREIEKAKFKRD